jgi:hypothetical protein
MTTVRVTDLKEPARVVNFATILPLVKPAETRLNLVASRERPAGINLDPTSRKTTPVQLRLEGRTTGWRGRLSQLKTRRFSMPRASGVVSRALGTSELATIGIAELDLPPGMPRFVNAATLKRMLRADASDLLLKRTGERWEICEASLRVDLLDSSVEFRLGAIQVWS